MSLTGEFLTELAQHLADGVKLPNYKCLFLLVNTIGIKGIYSDLRAINPGRVIDRPITEASWLLILQKLFEKKNRSRKAVERRTILTESRKLFYLGALQVFSSEANITKIWDERLEDLQRDGNFYAGFDKKSPFNNLLTLSPETRRFGFLLDMVKSYSAATPEMRELELEELNTLAIERYGDIFSSKVSSDTDSRRQFCAYCRKKITATMATVKKASESKEPTREAMITESAIDDTPVEENFGWGAFAHRPHPHSLESAEAPSTSNISATAIVENTSLDTVMSEPTLEAPRKRYTTLAIRNKITGKKTLSESYLLKQAKERPWVKKIPWIGLGDDL